MLTTHDLADVERLCRRVVLIDQGTVIYDGTVERLREQYGTHRTLVVTFDEAYGDIDVPGAEVIAHEANSVHLRFDRRTLTAEALIRRVTERYQIRDVAIIEPDIEVIVRRIYTEGVADAATSGAGP
jgi:ABC-2 type transport system ATP-binding protein